MAGDLLSVVRASYSIDEPWAFPDGCSVAELCRSTDGTRPRLMTRVAVSFDEHFLTFVFAGEDDGVIATHLEHDAALYEEDVVEIFLAPREASTYFEIEVNPLGTVFDARVRSPTGSRAGMSVDRAWTCEGLFCATRRQARSIDVVIRIPFSALGIGTPNGGERWRANLFRIDRSREAGDEFTAWRPTGKTPPDFHVVAAFGELVFEAPGRR